MSLYSDVVGDLTQNWKNAGWPTRCLLALSLILTTSSIASLSDLVFEWKGFIATGIESYKAWVRQPISGFIQFFGISFPQWVTDVLLLLLLWLVSLGRAVLILMRTQLKFGDMSIKPSSQLILWNFVEVSSILLIVLSVLLLVPVWYLWGFKLAIFLFPGLAFIVFGYTLYSMHTIVAGIHRNHNVEDDVKESILDTMISDSRASLSYYFLIPFAAILAVLILAAISDGLLRMK